MAPRAHLAKGATSSKIIIFIRPIAPRFARYWEYRSVGAFVVLASQVTSLFMWLPSMLYSLFSYCTVGEYSMQSGTSVTARDCCVYKTCV